jgi:hypothetical protein
LLLRLPPHAPARGRDYRLTISGDKIYFAQSGQQTILIQQRGDGVSIDQIVLSAVKYATTSPGANKNDTTVLPKTQ